MKILARVPHSRIAEDLRGGATLRRPRTRLLAPRVWARRSSVDGRIATHGPCHLHDPPAHDHPAVQFISRRTQPASLRGALSSSRNQLVDQPVNLTETRN